MTPMSRPSAVALGGAIALIIALASSASASAAGNGPILSPRSGQRLPAKPTMIRVTAGNHAKVFRAQLNGQPIARYFSTPSRRRVRTLRASRSYGLRHGKNRLHVRVRRAGGKKRSVWSRFRIRRNRPLAAAGKDHKVQAGDTVYLDGRRSRSHLPGDSELPQQWKIVGQPKRIPGAPLGAPSLSAGDTPTPVLTTTAPGRYSVKLTVAARDGTKGSDRLTVDALNPPLLAVDTMTELSGGKPGIKVGDTTYYADDTVQNPWFQVLVFKRDTLVPQSNKTYSCADVSAENICTSDGDHGNLEQDLDKLDDSDLVIVANHLGDDKWGAIYPGEANFHTIGALDYPPDSTLTGFSAIGVPQSGGLSANWNEDFSINGGGTAGRMTGSLVKDNIGNYTYLPPRITFDTQVLGSNESQNVMRVGDKTFTQQLPLDPKQHGAGGFCVLVLDPMLPEVNAHSYWFPTGEQNYDSGEVGRLNAMTNTLKQAIAAGKLVIIASRGNPATQGGPDDQQQNVNDAVKSLVDQIENLGGTRTDAYQALAPRVTKSGASYTLIGRPKLNGNKPEGIEAQGDSTTPAKALNTAALRGTLVRGNDYNFKVGDTAPSEIQDPGSPPLHMAGQKLNETLVQAPTPWPGKDDPGKQAAIAYIGQQEFAGDDVRTDYWTAGKDQDWWTQKQTDIASVSYPSTKTPDFTAADLDWAKAELNQEIDWLRSVQDFTTTLAEPFNKEGLQSWADLQSIADNVDNEVTPAKQDQAAAVADAIFNGAREAAEELPPPAGDAAGAVNAIFDTALEIAKVTGQGDEPAGKPFSVSVGDLGVELVERLNNAHDTLTTQITNAVVADYGKLKTVGACNLLDAKNCPDDPQEWKFDGADQLGAAKSLRYGAELADYAAIVPARWTLFQLNDSCNGSTGYTCWETDFQNDGFWGGVGAGNAPICPFLDEPRSAKLIRPLYRDIPRYRNDAINGDDNTDVWQTYALGNITGRGVAFDTFKSENPGGFLDKLFEPIDPGGDIDKGGLGAQPEEFFLGNMTPQLMAKRTAGGQPYPYRDSDPEWWGAPSSGKCPRW